ncbi:MAG TPA: TolC family protein [Burkholderiaceae bacterium]|nr:TolC family protein [Burkholderiaceae bacterium]
MRSPLIALLCAAALDAAAQPAVPAAGVAAPGASPGTSPAESSGASPGAPSAGSSGASSDARSGESRPGAAVAPGSLADLVERAWTIASRARVERARAEELDARELAARSPFAGPPVVGLDLRRDLPRGAGLPGTDESPERGRNEVEPGVSVPLWLPGQRDAIRRTIERDRSGRAASVRAARLALAGEVREAAWSLALARGALRVQRSREAGALALERDVERRVAAGELAPVDRLAARAERLAAAAAVREAIGVETAAAARLRTLAGVDAVGELAEPPPADPDRDAHPALAEAHEAVAAAAARLDLARRTRRDAPTVSAVARFDRDAYGADWRNTVRLGIAVPLDTEARNAPRLAAAGAALVEAEVARDRLRRELAGAIERARAELEAARETADVQAERAAAVREALAATERAFRAGERGLPDVLRLRALALDAELARDLSRERLGLAVSRLNQAFGVEP